MGTVPPVVTSIIAVCALAACAPTYHTSDVKSVTISATICRLTCSPAHAVLSSDGSVAYGFRNPIVGNNPTLVRQFIAQMPLDEMIALSRHHTAMTGDRDMATVSLSDGPTFTVTVLASSVGHTNQTPVQTWIVQTATIVQSIAMRDRVRSILKALRSGKGFGGARLRLDGCFGTCPAYTVWFASNGTATYDARRTPFSKAIHATAAIPAARVRQALAGGTMLEPYYPVQAVDTMGASIDIVVNGRHFTSDGPDSTTWSPEFRSIITRIDQLVVDTHWAPGLPERKP